MCPTAQNIPLRHIILGGEAADQPTLNALKKKYPKAKLTHVYASTEAGVAMSVSDGMAGFPISFTDSSNSKAQVKIENKRLFVKSKSSAYAYIGKTKLNDVDGWIDTGDLVLVDGNRFFVIGRASGIVNVGGDKVVPEKVRQLLLQHPKVVDAHVYGKKNPFTGMLLAADVQLTAGSEPKNAQEELQVFIRSKLPKTHEPKIIHLVEDIKTNSTGKVEQRK